MKQPNKEELKRIENDAKIVGIGIIIGIIAMSLLFLLSL